MKIFRRVVLKPPTRSRLYATELAVNPLTLSLVLSGKRRRCSYYQKHQPESQTLDCSSVCARSFHLAAFAICWRFLLRRLMPKALWIKSGSANCIACASLKDQAHGGLSREHRQPFLRSPDRTLKDRLAPLWLRNGRWTGNYYCRASHGKLEGRPSVALIDFKLPVLSLLQLQVYRLTSSGCYFHLHGIAWSVTAF